MITTMQIRVKATGEILNIKSSEIQTTVYDNCCMPIEFSLEEVEILPDDEKLSNIERTGKDCKEIDWEERRFELCKAALTGSLASPVVEGVDPNPSMQSMAKHIILLADTIISELKKQEKEK